MSGSGLREVVPAVGDGAGGKSGEFWLVVVSLKTGLNPAKSGYQQSLRLTGKWGWIRRLKKLSPRYKDSRFDRSLGGQFDT